MKALPLLAAALVVTAAGVAGCSSAPATPDAAPTLTAPAPTGTPHDYHLPDEDQETYPVWDQASRAQAVTAAQAAMAAFARPPAGTDEATWREGLHPTLTPTAQETYAYVDPAEVPATTVTGAGQLAEPEPGATAFLATVSVPTDAGTYEVLLARTGGSAPWLAERFTPPTDLTGPATAPPAPATA